MFDTLRETGINVVPIGKATASSNEVLCNCQLCGTRYIDVKWCQYDSCVEICNACTYKNRPIKGSGIQPTHTYLGGGKRIAVATTEYAIQLERLNTVIRALENEIKCKSN